MSLFDRLPDETISRIFTIGCDMDIHWWNADVDLATGAIHVLYESEGPIPHPFAANSRAVCQRWHAIVHTRSNAHMWCIFTKLGDPFLDLDDDRASELAIARFLSRLSFSHGCDIYVDYWRASHNIVSSDLLEIRILVLVLKLLKPYRLQLASLQFWLRSNTTTLVTQLIRGLEECPRLHSVRVGCDPEDKAISVEEDNGLADTIANTFALYSFDANDPHIHGGDAGRFSGLEFIRLYLPETNSNHQAWNFICRQLREIQIGGSVTLSWSNFERLIINCPFLRHLKTSISDDLSSASLADATSVLSIESKLLSLDLKIHDVEHIERVIRSLRLLSLEKLIIRSHRLPPTKVIFPNLPAVVPSEMPNFTAEPHIRTSSAAVMPKLRVIKVIEVELQKWEVLCRAIGEGPQLESIYYTFVQGIPEIAVANHRQDISSRLLCRTSDIVSLSFAGNPTKLFVVLSTLNLERTTCLIIGAWGSDVSASHPEGVILDIPFLTTVIVNAISMTRSLAVASCLIRNLYSATLTKCRLSDTGITADLYFIPVAAGNSDTFHPYSRLSNLEFRIGDSSENRILDYQDSFWSSPVILGVKEIRIIWERPRDLLDELTNAFQMFTGLPGADVPLPHLHHLEFSVDSKESTSASVRDLFSERLSSLFVKLVDARRLHKIPLSSFRLHVDGESYIDMVRDTYRST